jgi:hypothetical protein
MAWLLTLPYPVRSALRRWRGMVGMVLGVGIALGIGMTLLVVSRASVVAFMVIALPPIRLATQCGLEGYCSIPRMMTSTAASSSKPRALRVSSSL